METVYFSIRIGDKVEQITTGFQGIVVGSEVFLGAQKRHYVRAQTEESKRNIMPDSFWIDESELKIIGSIFENENKEKGMGFIK